jgi:polar amino acid transport system permease protein
MQNLDISKVIKSFPMLMDGFFITVKISIIALILSIILGFIVGIIMTSKNKVINFILKILLEAFRLIHPIIWLFIFFFGLAYIFDIQTNNIIVSIIVFTLWGTFEIGDLVRSYIKSLPKIQFESSIALGFSKIQMYIYIIIPQIIRRITPSIVNLATRLIKTTTIVFLSSKKRE